MGCFAADIWGNDYALDIRGAFEDLIASGEAPEVAARQVAVDRYDATSKAFLFLSRRRDLYYEWMNRLENRAITKILLDTGEITVREALSGYQDLITREMEAELLAGREPTDGMAKLAWKWEHSEPALQVLGQFKDELYLYLESQLSKKQMAIRVGAAEKRAVRAAREQADWADGYSLYGPRFQRVRKEVVR